MIYESASPRGPALPLQSSSCFHAHYIDTFRIFIYPALQFYHTRGTFLLVCLSGRYNHLVWVWLLSAERIGNTVPPQLYVEVLWQQCSSNYNSLHQRSHLPPPTSHSSVLTHHNPQPSHTEPGSLYCFLWAEWVFGGNRGDFHVQMSVSPLPAITGPSSPEIGAWDTAWII